MDLALLIPPSPRKNNIIRMIDCSHEAKANYLWQPNDFMIITSLLKPEDRVALIDGTADKLNDSDYLHAAQAVPADLIIVALSSVCWAADYQAFQKVRRLKQGIPLFVIGDIFLDGSYRKLILEQCDGIIFNPYLLDLDAMRRVRTGPGIAVLPGVATRPDAPVSLEGKGPILLSDTRPPRHEVFLKSGYRFPFAHHYRFSTVTTVWGCPFSCSYCSDANFPAVVRQAEDVMRELDILAGLGVRELFIADKVFGFSRRNADRLLTAMAERHRFGWSCYFHPQLYDPVLLDLMGRAGCHTIITGIDSADVSSLAQYGRRVESGKIDRLLGHACRIGISVCADFILGLEHESEDDIIRTIRFALEKPIDFASFNIAAPLPGSDIRQRAVSEGKLIFGAEGFDTCGRMGVIGSGRISAERLRELRKGAFRSFYLRPSYWLRRLRRTRSVEHFLIQAGEMLSMLRKYA